MSETTTRKQVAPALPREIFKPIKECRDLGELFQSADFRERIVASVPQYMTPDRMLSVVLRAHMSNPLLLKCTPQSFAGACLSATNTGLEPNSPLAEAHLIPFKTTKRGRGGAPDEEIVQIQTIFGYQGLLKLSTNTGRVLSVSANVVYMDSDIFDWEEGSNTFLKFKRGGRRERRDDDKPSYVYFHARLAGGGEPMEVLPYGEVLKIRNMSQAYRSALRAKANAEEKGWRIPPAWTEAPWVRFEEPMARKTAIRAGVKYLPKSVELAIATRLDELGERRTIDYSRVIDQAGNDAHPDYAGAAVTLGEQASVSWDDGDPDQDQGHDPTIQARRPVSNVTRSRTVDQTPTQQTPKQEPERQPPTDVHIPGFEAYLIGPDGEVEGDAFVDPVAWAKAFVAIAETASPDELQALTEHNADALEDARRAPIADQLLAVRDVAEDLPAPTVMVVGEKRDGSPDWRGYVAAFRDICFGWRGDLAAWLEVQRPVITQAPMAQRLLLLKVIRERGDQLKAGLPEWVIAMAKPEAPAAREEEPTPDEIWCADLIEEVDACETIPAVQEVVNRPEVQARMKRLSREKRPLFLSTEHAVDLKIASLKGQP